MPGRRRRQTRGAGEEGATATEYLFLMVLIALVIWTGAQYFGTNLGARFSTAGSEVTSAN